MNARQPPRCECERSPNGWKVRYFNCDDENTQAYAVKNRVEQIEGQRRGRSGLTNRERRALASELNFLKRQFKLGQFPVPIGKLDKRKEKAMEKKLRWLAKKADQANLQDR
jgi:hypothetical protein